MSGFDQKTTWVLVSDNVIDGPVVIRIPTADQGQRHGSSCPGGKKAEDWVFASDSHRAGVKRGKQPYWPSTIMRHFIQPVAKKVGIGNISWHTFRHTYSTLLHANGEDPKVVQELLRHSSIKVTMDVYTQAVTATKRKAQSRVVEMIVPKKPAGAMAPA